MAFFTVPNLVRLNMSTNHATSNPCGCAGIIVTDWHRRTALAKVDSLRALSNAVLRQEISPAEYATAAAQ